ncbi:hypothetical protein [Paracoccus sp. AK26]|uniref:hypothetical protein n=1 Tax=Paracoccus sp. AK26 TaxID=2589076 RepID=UPI0014280A4E|nr:hypothetical protein [Paracoccus sp. AK26]QIR85112.1 hypothetical protein FIU66_07755 [Paracoccus sp. AK26]
MNIDQLLWPHVSAMHPDRNLRDDLDRITRASWRGQAGVALEEARRLRDVETSRKVSAETKGQIYLGALLALIPIIVSLTEKEFIKEIFTFSAWYHYCGALLFFAAVIYGVGGFVSAFRSINVGNFNRVDVDELVASASAPDPQEYLVKELLKSVRCDRQAVNHKISYVIVTQQLVFRMALFFMLSLAVTEVGRLGEILVCSSQDRTKCLDR